MIQLLMNHDALSPKTIDALVPDQLWGAVAQRLQELHFPQEVKRIGGIGLPIEAIHHYPHWVTFLLSFPSPTGGFKQECSYPGLNVLAGLSRAYQNPTTKNIWLPLANWGGTAEMYKLNHTQPEKFLFHALAALDIEGEGIIAALQSIPEEFTLAHQVAVQTIALLEQGIPL